MSASKLDLHTILFTHWQPLTAAVLQCSLTTCWTLQGFGLNELGGWS